MEHLEYQKVIVGELFLRFLLLESFRRGFYPTNDWVNDIKVRVGYGVTGNQSPLDNYAHITRLATGRYVFNENEVSTLYPLVMPSPSIKWETVKQGNIGIDIALLQQRVNLTFDAYIKIQQICL